MEKGASITIGSKKYPIERERGHSCVIEPPVITPGLTKMAVPNVPLIMYLLAEG